MYTGMLQRRSALADTTAVKVLDAVRVVAAGAVFAMLALAET
jgi:hypothetical protein